MDVRVLEGRTGGLASRPQTSHACGSAKPQCTARRVHAAMLRCVGRACSVPAELTPPKTPLAVSSVRTIGDATTSCKRSPTSQILCPPLHQLYINI